MKKKNTHNSVPVPVPVPLSDDCYGGDHDVSNNQHDQVFTRSIYQLCGSQVVAQKCLLLATRKDSSLYLSPVAVRSRRPVKEWKF